MTYLVVNLLAQVNDGERLTIILALGNGEEGDLGDGFLLLRTLRPLSLAILPRVDVRARSIGNLQRVVPLLVLHLFRVLLFGLHRLLHRQVSPEEVEKDFEGNHRQRVVTQLVA